MKTLLVLIFIIIFLNGCTKNETTIDDCIKENKRYKIENVLNFRTGEKNKKVICIDD